jgi:hypothetical protein
MMFGITTRSVKKNKFSFCRKESKLRHNCKDLLFNAVWENSRSLLRNPYDAHKWALQENSALPDAASTYGHYRNLSG